MDLGMGNCINVDVCIDIDSDIATENDTTSIMDKSIFIDIAIGVGGSLMNLVVSRLLLACLHVVVFDV